MKRTLIAALTGLMLMACGAHAQTYTLRIGSGTVNDTSQEWMRLFKQGVESRSNGKIKVETYVAGSLGSSPSMVDGVALGTIEGAIPNTGFMVSLEPRFLVFDAIGIFDGPESSLKVLRNPAIHNRIAALGKDKGVETIAVFWHSPLAVVSSKAVRSVADFAGLKIRTPGGSPLAVKPVEKVGAAPISMALGDVLPALQNKVIDGAILGSTVASTLKYYDAVKYVTYLPKSMIFVTAVVNSGFMQKIGPDLAKIVREEAEKANEPAVKWGIADAKRGREVWKKGGGESIDMAPEAASAYLATVESVVVPIVARDKRVKEDYDALRAAAQQK